ncbi:hypothetical protein HELRODRAFT_189556 [Helobdella robusta]|uniref:SAM domain-containing protein n=1 Tax=Helobdella robusta TaxID=6412 RepID=T1FR54_HELRO|nr:hypothetical protein HELRODRAFT_189556 [Helobdella robusta]ESN92653.1 hypothetical protein HELRODRAFT_189556 [Helobdella robusta]
MDDVIDINNNNYNNNDNNNFVVKGSNCNGNSINVNNDRHPEGPPVNHLDPDAIEDRFRVDRKKLEELIKSKDGVLANDFFNNIMNETNVVIAWPSRLKIGAKSKKEKRERDREKIEKEREREKASSVGSSAISRDAMEQWPDPYVKVTGKPEAVADAKNRILSNLTTKSSRVTFKMNVSHTEHSHVIGKGGNNIKKDLLPLTFTFDVPIVSPAQINAELLTLIEELQRKYEVTVSIKPQLSSGYVMSVYIRTSVFNADSARKVADTIFGHVTGRDGVVLESMDTVHPHPWSKHETLSDLEPLFKEIGLMKYIGIDMATFLTLTDGDLKDLGITTFGARRKMLLAITNLNEKQSKIPPPPGLSHPFRDPSLLKRRDIISHSIRW